MTILRDNVALKRQVLKLHEEGLTLRKISDAVGISHQTVWRMIHDPDGAINRENSRRERELAKLKPPAPPKVQKTPDEQRAEKLEWGRQYIDEHGRPPASRVATARSWIKPLFGSWGGFLHELGYQPYIGNAQMVPTAPVVEAVDAWQRRTGRTIVSLACRDYPADRILQIWTRAQSRDTMGEETADVLLTRTGNAYLWIADRRLWGIGCVPFDGPGF